jgi:hypothetical protein
MLEQNWNLKMISPPTIYYVHTIHLPDAKCDECVINIEEKCSVCFVEMQTDDEVIAHPNVQNRKLIHLIHTECLEDWATVQKVCPICRIEFSEISRYGWNSTLKYKAIKNLTILLKDLMVRGAVGGIIAAISGTILSVPGYLIFRRQEPFAEYFTVMLVSSLATGVLAVLIGSLLKHNSNQ